MPDQEPQLPAIVTVDHIDQNAVLIALSDGTSIILTLEELLAMRPSRELTDEPSATI